MGVGYLGFLVEESFNVKHDIIWSCFGTVTLHWYAFPVDQKLGEVPLDGVQDSASLLLLEELVEWVGVAAIDVDLTAELVAGEGEDAESLVLVLWVEGTQLCVVECRQSSLGGHIHHQTHIPTVPRQTHLLPVYRIGFKLINSLLLLITGHLRASS